MLNNPNATAVIKIQKSNYKPDFGGYWTFRIETNLKVDTFYTVGRIDYPSKSAAIGASIETARFLGIEDSSIKVVNGSKLKAYSNITGCK